MISLRWRESPSAWASAAVESVPAGAFAGRTGTRGAARVQAASHMAHGPLAIIGIYNTD